jgi:hypothetical protein
VCSESKSIKHGSWFQHSNLTFQEVLLLTYDIVRRVPTKRIEEEHRFSLTTILDWGQFCRETMLVYMQGCSEKMGGPNKIVEIDESKFYRLKYDKDHAVKGQWVFSGVEPNSGRTFFVPVSDRSTKTLTAVIDAWIEPGTTVVSSCWGAYHNHEAQGYMQHLTVKHTIGFVDPHTGAHTNRIDSCGRHLEVFVNPYNRKKGYIYDMADYMFAAKCKGENVDRFTKFLHLAATTNWSLPPPSSSAST